MIRKKLLTLVAASAMVATIQTAQASISGQLLNGGSITIDDKTFSNIGYVATGADESELAADAADLAVTAYILDGIYYLDFKGLIAVNNTGNSDLVGDLALSYTVTVNDPSRPISMIDQQYTPNALPATGQIIIAETALNPATGVGGNSTLTLNPTDLSDPLPEVGDNLYIGPPQLQLQVIKDIAISAKAGQLVGLSDVKQSFHEVPEPTTMIAGALLLLPFGASTLRILRKKQTA
jgi:hypothetical protein